MPIETSAEQSLAEYFGSLIMNPDVNDKVTKTDLGDLALIAKLPLGDLDAIITNTNRWFHGIRVSNLKSSASVFNYVVARYLFSLHSKNPYSKENLANRLRLFDFIKLMLNKGILQAENYENSEITFKQMRGKALHFAAFYNDRSMVSYLLEAGANPFLTASSDDYRTPFTWIDKKTHDILVIAQHVHTIYPNIYSIFPLNALCRIHSYLNDLNSPRLFSLFSEEKQKTVQYLDDHLAYFHKNNGDIRKLEDLLTVIGVKNPEKFTTKYKAKENSIASSNPFITQILPDENTRLIGRSIDLPERSSRYGTMN